MSVTEMEDVYGELLKRYRELGYLSPEDALNYDIRLLADKGKATGEAILRRYKGANDETIALIERYITARTRIPKPEEDRVVQSVPRGRVQRKDEEVMEIQP